MHLHQRYQQIVRFCWLFRQMLHDKTVTQELYGYGANVQFRQGDKVMIRYIIKRLFLMIFVVFGVLVIVFFLNEITPGDAASHLAGAEATPEQIQEVRVRLGLDQPVLVRFGNYLVGIVTRGDLGTSYITRQPILKEILDFFPTTLLLTIYSTLFSLIIGVPIGIISAVKQYSWIDNLSMAVSMFGVAVPQFWLGLMLMIIFAVRLHWFPAIGTDNWLGWILPIFTLGLTGAASMARTTRSAMLDEIRQDYTRTAKAKGQSKSRVVIFHAFRCALIPVITVIGIQIGATLGGAVLVEQVFSLPGLGKYMVDAIKSQNYPAVQGGVAFLAVVFSFLNLIIDIVYAFIDPRIKAQYARKKPKKIAKTAPSGKVVA